MNSRETEIPEKLARTTEEMANEEVIDSLRATLTSFEDDIGRKAANREIRSRSAASLIFLEDAVRRKTVITTPLASTKEDTPRLACAALGVPTNTGPLEGALIEANRGAIDPFTGKEDASVMSPDFLETSLTEEENLRRAAEVKDFEEMNAMIEQQIQALPNAPAIRENQAPDVPESRPGAFATGGRAPFFGLAQESDLFGDSRVCTSIASGCETTAADTEGLAEARPVSAINEGCLEEAEPVVARNDKRIQGSLKCIVFAVALLAATFLIPTLLILFNGDNDTVKPAVGDVQKTNAKRDYLLSILHTNGLEIPKLSEPTSQTLAFEWLVEDPNLLNYSRDRAIQRYALSAFYYSTRGPLWKRDRNWLSYSHHECSWYMNTIFFGYIEQDISDSPCNNVTGLYERLWLGENNLHGSLPEEFYALTSLQSVDMLLNRDLSGTISAKIGELKKMERFSLLHTAVDGTIPSEIGLLENLQVFALTKEETSTARFHGTIPSEFWKLTSVQEVSFNHQNFWGALPRDLSHMTDLRGIGMIRNDISGSIPTDWGRLSRLRFMYIWGNSLTGSVPSEFGLLPKLEVLHLSNNRLTGSIATELGLATSLKEIVLANNTGLVGMIPSELGELRDLWMLYISQNPGLTGSFPTELYHLTGVKAFDIADTNVTGDVPLWMQHAQNETPFIRYQTECRRWFPCPDW